MRFKRLLLRLLLLILIIICFNAIISAANAGELHDFKTNDPKKTINGTTITFIDVAANDRSCIFKINGKTIVIQKNKIYDGENFSLWVKNAYALRNADKDADLCQVIISAGEAVEKKEIISVN